MYKITLKINGMMCGMCESHVNDAFRKAFPDLKKVSSSHAKNRAELLSETPYAESALHAALAPTGYRIEDVTLEPYEKKPLFGFLKKK